MGDLSSPKRREVFDRLRRRYEFYRRHQNGSLRRFENTINGLYEQQRQDTVLLHQRWLESRAKKVSKQSKASKDSSAGHGTDPRNLVVTQRLKKKIDSSQTENPPVDTSAFDFDDSDTTTTKKTVNAGSQGLDVSVHIVQQISGNSHPDQKIQTNVNVSTTVKTHYSGAPPEQGSAQSSANVETSTSFECKQEQGADDIPCGGSNQSDSSHNSSDILNQAELDDILNTIDNGDSEISDELIEELKKFDQIYTKVLQEDSNDSQDKMFNMTSTSPVLQKGPGPYPDATPTGYDSNQNLNPVRTPPMPQNFRSHLSETGPAAETLKQMAAQHQSLQQDVYGMKTMEDTFSQTNTNYRQNGYPPNMNQQQHFLSSQQAGYLGQQHGINSMRGPVPYGQGKADMSLTYGGTKPLSHYSTPQGSSQPATPSSLQQLQNQVQAHFDQGTQMEITQTQHMQVSDGPHRMQMSQTQQLQMRPPHQIAMSQHQSFSMPGGNMTPNQSQYMNEQMNMEMVEKMRKQQQQHTAPSQHPNQQQQQQSHPSQPTHPQQQQQQHAQQQRSQQQHTQQQQTMIDRQAAQMQQYMGRPPPEYKMQPSSQGAPEGYTPNGVGSNPLQTMQNMVNQTNTMQTAGYGQIKSESGSVQMHNGMMQSAQMSTLQRMNSAGPAVGMPGPVSASPVPGASAPYAGQPSIQRQQSYPGTQNSAQEPRQPRPGGTTYTSAIMRNQRPPNVNVGPDGLNISQPRTQHEWPRQMVPGPQGPRYAGPPHQGGPGAMSRPQMSAASMMQYGSYTNQCGTMNSVAGIQMQRQTRPMQMSAMQSQQAAMMQGSTQQMMMQQQNMQISQRMNIRGPIPGASGTMAPSMDANPAGYNATPGGTHGHQEDFINLLDSAQTGNSDFIDGITVQSSDGNNDANWLDEILGAK
ncbi:putative mediator of RNA polymerase II transcription subunit 26 [Ylistrum balloti]|uniref:putative mediator of RNA polymerase II transcription subunit 26 n=1 Tax=Ylistrum balloti TaxID=509963 RepID=UPI002905F771|nr:putative mediator of RNA polymerase II transcription subunit 26 [Ylistrum balloti]